MNAPEGTVQERPRRIPKALMRKARKAMQKEAQRLGMARAEARRLVYGPIRSTPNPTRGQLLQAAYAEHRAQRIVKRRRAQAVAASVATSEAAF